MRSIRNLRREREYLGIGLTGVRPAREAGIGQPHPQTLGPPQAMGQRRPTAASTSVATAAREVNIDFLVEGRIQHSITSRQHFLALVSVKVFFLPIGTRLESPKVGRFDIPTQSCSILVDFMTDHRTSERTWGLRQQ